MIGIKCFLILGLSAPPICVLPAIGEMPMPCSLVEASAWHLTGRLDDAAYARKWAPLDAGEQRTLALPAHRLSGEAAHMTGNDSDELTTEAKLGILLGLAGAIALAVYAYH
jgi:hypothetical protein